VLSVTRNIFHYTSCILAQISDTREIFSLYPNVILLDQLWWISHILQHLYLVTQIALQGSYSHNSPLCDVVISIIRPTAPYFPLHQGHAW
jgi:hypothetical protein